MRLAIALLLLAGCSSPTAPETAAPDLHSVTLRYPIPSVGEYAPTFDAGCVLEGATIAHNDIALHLRCP